MHVNIVHKKRNHIGENDDEVTHILHSKQMIDTSKFDLPLSKTKINVVLVLNGCFNPIHRHHILTLEVAREHLISLGKYHIVGGYLLPSHDGSIEQKSIGTQVRWQDRLAMCQLMVQDSLWIAVDDWKLYQEKNYGSYIAQKRLLKILRETFPSIEIVSTCGTDALPKFQTSFTEGLTICVRNRPFDRFQFDAWFFSEDIQKYHHNIIIIDDPTANKNISSTIIRECIRQNQLDSIIDDLHPSVLAYHQDKGIDYRPNGNSSILVSDSKSKSTDQSDTIVEEN